MMRWTETIDIDAPEDLVRTAMLDQHHVVRWSAWPEATGLSCTVHGDGTSPGSEIVFRDDAGTVQGRQRITAVDGQRIANRLENRGPLGRTMTPRVDFVVTRLAHDRTRAALDFEADVPLPVGLRHLVQLAMSRWARRLHVEDLRLLKSYVESGAVDVGQGET